MYIHTGPWDVGRGRGRGSGSGIVDSLNCGIWMGIRGFEGFEGLFEGLFEGFEGFDESKQTNTT